MGFARSSRQGLYVKYGGAEAVKSEHHVSYRPDTRCATGDEGEGRDGKSVTPGPGKPRSCWRASYWSSSRPGDLILVRFVQRTGTMVPPRERLGRAVPRDRKVICYVAAAEARIYHSAPAEASLRSS